MLSAVYQLVPHSVPISVRSVVSAVPTGEDETEMQPTSSGSSTTNYLRHKTSQIFDAVMTNGKKKEPADTRCACFGKFGGFLCK
jgi:hypothetical protein